MKQSRYRMGLLLTIAVGIAFGALLMLNFYSG